jgi:hypothetical protein
VIEKLRFVHDTVIGAGRENQSSDAAARAATAEAEVADQPAVA